MKAWSGSDLCDFSVVKTKAASTFLSVRPGPHKVFSIAVRSFATSFIGKDLASVAYKTLLMAAASRRYSFPGLGIGKVAMR